MNLQKMVVKNRQVLEDWKLLFLNKFESNYLNRHAVRRMKYDVESFPGGRKRDKKQAKAKKEARRKNRRAKQ